MRPATALLVVLLSAGVAFAAGWFAQAQPESEEPEAASAPTAAPAPAGNGAAAALLDATRQQLADAHAERRRLEQERDHLRRELAARRASGAAEGPEEAAGSHEPRYRYEGFETALTSIDWTKSAEAVVNLSALLAEFGRGIAKGDTESGDWRKVIGKLQRWNGPLVSAAISAQNGKVPGTGVNGAFSHPSVMANLVHATLLEAGEPLDATQETALRELGKRYVDEDAQRLAGYAEGTLALEKTIDEAALKDRFYAEVDRLVNDVQREILHPEETRGRVTLDLFSSGIIWITMAEPARYRSRDNLIEMLATRAQRHFGIEDQDLVVEAARQWGGSFSREYIDEEPDALARAGRFRIERVNVAARAQLLFYKSLLDRLPADSPAANKVRAETGIVVPMRRL